MRDENKRLTPQDLGAFGVGLSVTIASSVLTSMFSPIPFPFNFLISFALGGTALYGTHKILDPRTMNEVVEQRTEREFRSMLSEISKIAKRTEEASRNPYAGSEHLGSIAKMIEKILKRYQERRRDFAGASSTLLVLQKFDGLLTLYLKIKKGELFADEELLEKEVTEMETQVFPMFEQALENLGKKLDIGETLGSDVSKGTLESMLRSLDLIESLKDQLDSPPPMKEAPDDA